MRDLLIMKHKRLLLSLLCMGLILPTVVVAESSEDVPAKIRDEITRKLGQIPHGKPQFALSGTLETDSKGGYSINGESFAMDKETQVIGDLQVGQFASVRGDFEAGKKLAKVLVLKKPTTDDTSIPKGSAHGNRNHKLDR